MTADEKLLPELMTKETATGGLVKIDEHLSQRMQSGLDISTGALSVTGLAGNLNWSGVDGGELTAVVVVVVGLAGVGGGCCLIGTASTTTAGIAVTMSSGCCSGLPEAPDG